MCSINWVGWAQAIAAFAIVYFTYRSLMVLKDYAADTKKIANASAEQTENSQKPFIVLISKRADVGPEHARGWCLENQGFGPALNVRYTHGFDPRVWEYTTPVFGKGQYLELTRFNIDTVRQHKYNIEYESLSRKKYWTSIIWVDGEMRTTFHGPE